MAGFLYFVPRAPVLQADGGPAFLAGLGLADVFRGSGASSMGATAGPDGIGLLFAVGGPGPDRFRYAPEAQRWEREAGGRFWLGCWRESPPAPAELLRPEAERVEGLPVELADGNRWAVPMARRWTEFDGQPGFVCALEHSVRRDAAGEVSFNAVVPRLRSLWDDACAVAEAMFSGGPHPEGRAYRTGDFHARLVRLLAVNHRVGPAEADFLGLVSAAAAGRAFDVLADVAGFNAVAAMLASKKNGSGTSGP